MPLLTIMNLLQNGDVDEERVRRRNKTKNNKRRFPSGMTNKKCKSKSDDNGKGNGNGNGEASQGEVLPRLGLRVR